MSGNKNHGSALFCIIYPGLPGGPIGMVSASLRYPFIMRKEAKENFLKSKNVFVDSTHVFLRKNFPQIECSKVAKGGLQVC